MTYEPGTYVKGDVARVASSRSEAVALVFDGYARKVDAPADDTDYRDLQAQAKELGIPANQSADVLREQIDAELNKPSGDTDGDNPFAPDIGGNFPLYADND